MCNERNKTKISSKNHIFNKTILQNRKRNNIFLDKQKLREFFAKTAL